MKVAILIDWLGGRGGGEKTVYYMAKKYNADIYTTYALWDKILPEFKELKVNIIPGIRHFPLVKQELAVRLFKKLKLQRYDVIICLGYYSIYAATNNKPVVWYPYGISSIFYGKGPEDNRAKDPLWKLGAWLWKARIEKSDKKVVREHIKEIVTISEYARSVINKYHFRDSAVIPPPVELGKFKYKPSKGYYLLVARLETGKRVDLAVSAFRKMPHKTLYIEGAGNFEKRLRELADGAENIKFLGRVSSEELVELYSNCIALIGTAYYDEWSMPMVEAMASGKPCIAVNQGAYPEIIVNGKTGILVDGTPEGIMHGVRRISEDVARSMKKDCIKRAHKFSSRAFFLKWDRVIERFR